MKEYPIIFGAESIRAILEGHKTQTRRVMKPQPKNVVIDEKTVYVKNGISSPMRWFKFDHLTNGKIEYLRPAVNEKPTKKKIIKAARWLYAYHQGDVKWSEDEVIGLSKYGKVGDRLWVREKFSIGGNGYFYETNTDGTVHIAWTSPIFMPREASRLMLEITNIRVERLQEIKALDIVAEGVDFDQHYSIEGTGALTPCDEVRAFHTFQEGWDKLNAKRGYGWSVNPWVWVIEFKRM